MIANLDNEVYFKHVFTDVEVFQEFVKDILNIEIKIEKVETEKVLPDPVSAIKFRMDLFAEDIESRAVVEIQKVDYDYTYDRFSHYFLANLIDVQRSSKAYAYEKDVYVIVVMTSSYRINEKNGMPIRDDVLITDLNPRTLNGTMRHMQNHKMIILNPKYINEETPANIKDWLDLIKESMFNRDDPQVNTTKKGIAKAVDLAQLSKITPEQLAEAKIAQMKKAARIYIENQAKQDGFTEGLEEGRQKGREEGMEEGREEGLKKGIEQGREEGLKKGIEQGIEKGIEQGIEKGIEQGKQMGIEEGQKIVIDKAITRALERGKLSVEEIAEDFEVSIPYVTQLRDNTD